jgi:hypothetical protein
VVNEKHSNVGATVNQVAIDTSTKAGVWRTQETASAYSGEVICEPDWKENHQQRFL